MPELYLPQFCRPGDVSYRALSEHIKSLILSGVLYPGTSLPPIRELSSRLSVSTLTIQRAYAELSRAGYTEAATHRGTWVADRLTRSASMEFLIKLARADSGHSLGEITEAAGLRSLASAAPDPELFDDNDLCTELSDLRRASKWSWGYSPTHGAKELLAQISRLLRCRDLPTSGDQLLVTMGATHALSLVARTFSGSVVLLEEPRATGLKSVLEHSGAKIVPFKHDGSGIDLAQIAELIDRHSPTAIIISPLFQNPTGAVLDPNVGSRSSRFGAAARCFYG